MTLVFQHVSRSGSWHWSTDVQDVMFQESVDEVLCAIFWVGIWKRYQSRDSQLTQVNHYMSMFVRESVDS